MAGMMSITIAGNVGSDPEYHTEGTHRLSFRVAVNTWDKKTGEKTTWFGVTAWGAYADSLAEGQRIYKGATVVVSGQLSPREYQTKSGEKATALDVKPDQIQVVSGRMLADTTGNLEDVPF